MQGLIKGFKNQQTLLIRYHFCPSKSSPDSTAYYIYDIFFANPEKVEGLLITMVFTPHINSKQKLYLYKLFIRTCITESPKYYQHIVN